MTPVALTSLWLPILVSAFAVFIVSSIIHMALSYHRSDFVKAPQEDQLMDAMRRFNIPPGDYMIPCAGSPSAMNEPAFIEKMNKGPVAVMTVMKNGPWSMGPQLAQWFLFSVVVSLFAGYLSSRALGPGAPYLEVSQFASTVAFVAYALGQWPQTIWYQRKVSTSIKATVDGLIYGFVTGGVFGWLWPQ
jgi:hypothetical protein